ncbi:ATP-binding protein [Falsiroseomonas stagni]|uniref:histidine kinase n=1 Tax=Falsiroseomonas stagni DSM 19981 TaxID=1123062 RepID=A0A1I3ZZT9_9PROT|nr:ATP-binding protein [Falsiroseomonas stagni]SFK49387.1 PAS fold-containing protein [Falsiroseomonas stagni DSM 19981]
MIPTLDIPTALLVSAVVGALATVLADVTLRREHDLPCRRAWLGCSAAQALACFLQATRGGTVPELVAVVGANGAQVLALGLLWLGARRLRGAPTPVWFAILPAVVWLLACTLPWFLHDRLVRQLLLWPVILVLLASTARELWRVAGELSLPSAKTLSLVIGGIALLPVLRLVQLGLEAPFTIDILTVLAIVVLSTAVPFMALSVAIERMQQLRAEGEAAAASTGRAGIERLLGGLPAVIFLREVDAGGALRLLYRGGDFEAVTGWPAAKLVSLDDMSAYSKPGDPKLRELLPQMLRDGQGSYEWRMLQPDGTWRWMQSLVRVLGKRPDGMVEIVGYTLDITAMREARAQSLSAARLASLGEMAAGLAHELKQPLQAISLAADIAQVALARQDGAEADRRLDTIVEQSQRTASLIDRLRRFARGAEADEVLGPVKLADAVAGALELMRFTLRNASVCVEVALGDPPPVVRAQAILLEQVLSNLLLNARDALAALPAGVARRIRIAAEPVAGGEAGAMVRLVVADTGGGIPAAVMGQLFEPFVTTKGPDRGTGLGLSICYGLVRSMGGSIEARNDAQGAVITITLQAAEEKPPADEARPAVPAA